MFGKCVWTSSVFDIFCWKDYAYQPEKKRMSWENRVWAGKFLNFCWKKKMNIESEKNVFGNSAENLLFLTFPTEKNMRMSQENRVWAGKATYELGNSSSFCWKTKRNFRTEKIYFREFRLNIFCFVIFGWKKYAYEPGKARISQEIWHFC